MNKGVVRQKPSRYNQGIKRDHKGNTNNQSATTSKTGWKRKEGSQKKGWGMRTHEGKEEANL